MNGRIRVRICRIGHGFLYSVIIVVAIDLIALIVDQGRIPVDDGSLVTCMLDYFFVGGRGHGRCQVAFSDESGPFQEFVAAVGVLFDGGVRVGFWHAKSSISD